MELPAPETLNLYCRFIVSIIDAVTLTMSLYSTSIDGYVSYSIYLLLALLQYIPFYLEFIQLLF